MAEGVASAATGAVVGEPVWDDPAAEPAADPQLAPKGWTWNRAARRWVPRARWAPGTGPQQQDTPAPAAEQQPKGGGVLAHLRRGYGGADRDSAAGDGTGPGAAPGPAGRDPDPAWAASPGGSAGTWDPSQVSGEVQDDIAGMLALFYSVPADFLITVDPYCFGALNENLQDTIDATVPIICRSRRAVEFVTGASGLMLWIKLIATLKPFWVAVWQHHVIHSVQLVPETDKDGKPTGNLLIEDAGKAAVTVQQQNFSEYPAS